MALLIIFIGMPHGAGDIIVIFKKFCVRAGVLFSLLYFLFFILGMIFWANYSNLFFMILWPISLFHFFDVERQFVKNKSPAFEDIMFFLLFTLPLIKQNNFQTYLHALNGGMFYLNFINLKTLILFTQIILTIFIAFRNFQLKHHLYHLSLWTLIGLISHYLDLITCFFLIFIFVHSLRHLKLSFVKKIITRTNYFVILLPTSIISMGVIYYFQKNFTIVKDGNLFLIIGIGSLTFPHLLVELFMARGYSIKNMNK